MHEFCVGALPPNSRLPHGFFAKHPDNWQALFFAPPTALRCTMPPLTPHESRVLGVMVEKAMTTPAQYPLTLNALTTGCNQKNNRAPVLSLTEEQVFDAVDLLRRKNLAREVMLSGSRVSKFKHEAREGLKVNTEELVLLVELLLRGPQPAGELRANASRMHPFESLDRVEETLQSLMRDDTTAGRPLVRRLPTSPGERSPRYVQLLCPDLHPLTSPRTDHTAENSHEAIPGTGTAATHSTNAIAQLEARLAALEAEVAMLKKSLGINDTAK